MIAGRRHFIRILLITACVLSTLKSPAAAASFQFFIVPGATSVFPASINDTMSVTGWYTRADGTTHAFSRNPSGKVTTFDIGAFSTQPARINAEGEIAGTCSDVNGVDQGFVRLPNGTTTRFQLGSSTQITDMNVSGTVIGIYVDDVGSHAFYRTKNGFVVSFSIPGSTWVYPESVNDAGQIAGFFFFNGGYDGGVGGFVRTPDGSISTFVASGGIVPLALNQTGITAGWYTPPVGSFAPFVRDSDGVITHFHAPGDLVTQAMSVTTAGVIAGSYTTTDVKNPNAPAIVTHGFLRTPQGAITTFDAPDAVNTFLTAMNETNVVLGYADEAAGPVGFLLIPGGLFTP